MTVWVTLGVVQDWECCSRSVPVGVASTMGVHMDIHIVAGG